MKKIVLFITMIAFSSIVFGQNLKEKKINYFVDSATKEFSLTKEQSKQLKDARVALLDQMGTVAQEAKEGKITDEEKTEKLKEPNRVFRAEFEKITGKTNKDLQPFYKRMSEEIPNVR